MHLIITRYVMGYVLNATLMTLLLILSLDFIASIVDQSEDLSEKYTLYHSLVIALLELPGEIHGYLPATMLIGSLVGLGMLSSTNEITVMRSAGMSKIHLFGISCIPVVIIALAGLLIIEYVVPACHSKLAQIEVQVKGWSASTPTRSSLWSREGNDFIYIRAFRPDTSIAGLTMFRFDKERKMSSFLHADSATYDDSHWALEKVKLVNLADERTESKQLDSYLWKSSLNPKLLRVLTEEPHHLSTTNLWLNLKYRQSQDLDVAEYEHTFWTRLFQPLVCCALLLVGISSLFGPMREANMGYRVFIGVLIGYTFNVLQELLAQLTLAYQLPAFLVSIFPILLVAGVGAYLLRRD